MMVMSLKKLFYTVIAVPILVHMIILMTSFYRIIVSEDVSDKVFSKYEKKIVSHKCREKEVKHRNLVKVQFVFMDGQELSYERFNLDCNKISEHIDNKGDFITFYIFELFWYTKIVQVDLNNEVLVGYEQEKEGVLGLLRLILFVCIPMAFIGFFVKNKFNK